MIISLIFLNHRYLCTSLRAEVSFLHGWLSAMVSHYCWVLSRCRQERDCNAVPFERQFISQSLFKCDRSLSLESARKA